MNTLKSIVSIIVIFSFFTTAPTFSEPAYKNTEVSTFSDLPYEV